MKKHLIEFIGVSEEKLPEIFLDMDQVMCNFLKGADKAVGGSFVQHPTPDRWKILEKTKDFWLNLEWKAFCVLIQYCLNHFSKHLHHLDHDD